MARYETTVTATAKGSITYEFTCTTCGKNAFVRRPIEETETFLSVDRNVNIEDFKGRSQAKVEDRLRKRLQEIREMAPTKQYELVGDMGKCSHCGASQPWADVGTIVKPPSVFMILAIFLGIGALITVIMGIFGKFYDEAGFFLLIPPILLAIVGLVIGIVTNRNYAAKMDAKVKAIQKLPPTELPVVRID